MNLDEAKEFLNQCERSELRDHAFGDAEVYWSLNGEEVATGYFGSSGTGGVSILHNGVTTNFEKDEAQQLRNCGALTNTTRNDETGPDEYQEGVTMPALTLEGVRRELTGE